MEELISLAADKRLYFNEAVFKDNESVEKMKKYLNDFEQVSEESLIAFHKVFVTCVISGNWFYKCPEGMYREGFKFVFSNDGVLKSANGEKRVDQFTATIKNGN